MAHVDAEFTKPFRDRIAQSMGWKVARNPKHPDVWFHPPTVHVQEEHPIAPTLDAAMKCVPLEVDNFTIQYHRVDGWHAFAMSDGSNFHAIDQASPEEAVFRVVAQLVDARCGPRRA